MSRSRLGKKASKKLAIENLKKLIDEKFEKVNFDDRRKLFEDLQAWAKNTMNEEACDMFIQALYEAKSTQDIQLTMALENALERIDFGGKK